MVLSSVSRSISNRHPRRSHSDPSQDKSSGNSAMKIEALSFLKTLMASNPPALFQPHAKALSAPLFACTAERYYKAREMQRHTHSQRLDAWPSH